MQPGQPTAAQRIAGTFAPKLAFYSGWPNALTAVTVAREVFEKK
jgi:alkylhydroperoxidase/carboxymuconolactone decarboxylase family protein YurZ